MYSYETIRDTCCQMLEKRGYEIMETGDPERIDLEARDEEGDIIAVIISENNNLDSDRIKEYTKIFYSNSIFHGIIVCTDITPGAKNTINDTKDIRIEFFKSLQMMYNITTHKWQPECRKIAREDIPQIKDVSNLPAIGSEDAIVKFYGFQKGDVIETVDSKGMVDYTLVIPS